MYKNSIAAAATFDGREIIAPRSCHDQTYRNTYWDSVNKSAIWQV